MVYAPARRMLRQVLGAAALVLLLGADPNPAHAALIFTTGSPDGRLGSASRPAVPGPIEIESADDFILNTSASITGANFTGILVGGSLADISQVGVEIYRVFPLDSANPPSGNVPTRANSPSDVAFDGRDSSAAPPGGLTFATGLLSPTFTASNSVLNGINKAPNQTTGGEGAVTGTEVQFDVQFNLPFQLPADHYFFVPQVGMSRGEFYWLSAPRPQFAGDLQSWIRNENLQPDWLRIGTDILGGAPPPTFNASFSLFGESTPEPSTWTLFGLGLAALLVSHRRKREPNRTRK